MSRDQNAGQSHSMKTDNDINIDIDILFAFHKSNIKYNK